MKWETLFFVWEGERGLVQVIKSILTIFFPHEVGEQFYIRGWDRTSLQGLAPMRVDSSHHTWCGRTFFFSFLFSWGWRKDWLTESTSSWGLNVLTTAVGGHLFIRGRKRKRDLKLWKTLVKAGQKTKKDSWRTDLGYGFLVILMYPVQGFYLDHREMWRGCFPWSTARMGGFCCICRFLYFSTFFFLF
jgi:hypothetical protein